MSTYASNEKSPIGTVVSCCYTQLHANLVFRWWLYIIPNHNPVLKRKPYSYPNH